MKYFLLVLFFAQMCFALTCLRIEIDDHDYQIHFTPEADNSLQGQISLQEEGTWYEGIFFWNIEQNGRLEIQCADKDSPFGNKQFYFNPLNLQMIAANRSAWVFMSDISDPIQVRIRACE